jgi:hypothetical protein
VLLNNVCIEFTEEFTNALDTVQDAETLAKFLGTYGKTRLLEQGKPAELISGEFYVSRLRVGAKLFTSETSSQVEGSSNTEKAKSWKATAEASFKYMSFSGRVKGSVEKGSEESSGKSTSSETNKVSWEAIGGNPKYAQE